MAIFYENFERKPTIDIIYYSFDIFTDLYEMKTLLKCSNLKLVESLEALTLGMEKNCSFRIKKKKKKRTSNEYKSKRTKSYVFLAF